MQPGIARRAFQSVPRPESPPPFVSQAVRAVSRGDLQQTFPLWQVRLVVELWNSRVMLNPADRHDALLTSEFLPVTKNMVDVALDSWLKGENGQKVGTARFKPTWVCVCVFSCSGVRCRVTECVSSCFPAAQ